MPESKSIAQSILSHTVTWDARSLNYTHWVEEPHGAIHSDISVCIRSSLTSSKFEDFLFIHQFSRSPVSRGDTVPPAHDCCSRPAAPERKEPVHTSILSFSIRVALAPIARAFTSGIDLLVCMNTLSINDNRLDYNEHYSLDEAVAITAKVSDDFMCAWIVNVQSAKKQPLHTTPSHTSLALVRLISESHAAVCVMASCNSWQMLLCNLQGVNIYFSKSPDFLNIFLPNMWLCQELKNIESFATRSTSSWVKISPVYWDRSEAAMGKAFWGEAWVTN